MGSLTVFQRRPNWARRSTTGDLRGGDGRHPAALRRIFGTCAARRGGFEHEPDRRSFYNVSREGAWRCGTSSTTCRGFAIWLRNFMEIFVLSRTPGSLEYIADRIRQRVKDPKVAEKLIPRDHGFGVQRVPMETNYFEVYNQDNVELVDIS
ncbi:MAG: hypothetical protein R2749_15320 [Acidimicrobiales bacterium]